MAFRQFRTYRLEVPQVVGNINLRRKKEKWKPKGREREEITAHLSADGCFHAFRISPTCILSKLMLTSLSFSTASFSGNFFFCSAAALFPVTFFLKFQKNKRAMSLCRNITVEKNLELRATIKISQISNRDLNLTNTIYWSKC